MILEIYNFFNSMIYKNKYKKAIIKTRYIGRNVKIGDYCIINKNTYIGKNTEIGDFTYFNTASLSINIESNTSIGRFCSIGPGVYIGIGNHEMNFLTTHPILTDKFYKKILNIDNVDNNNKIEKKIEKTEIGNDVWIGANAIILEGVKVGNGAIIGAGAVVTKDVEEYEIVGGVPAKTIRYRFNEETRKLLKNKKEKWWDWDLNRLRENYNQLFNVEEYIKKQ